MNRLIGQQPRPAGSLLRNGAPPLVIAHRGASSQAPENTMAAFHRGWDAGARWLETDVQPTADLVPVLIHDDDLDRTTSGVGPVRGLRYAELAALDAGSWFDPRFAGEPVPTLHAMLSALPEDGRVLLEIKGPHSPADLVAELAVIRATGTDSRVWLQSFETEALRELAQALPGGWLGLLRDGLDADPVAVCRDLAAASYNPDLASVLDRPELVAELHAAGISTVIYTVDDPVDWARLTELEVDGIFTNRPAELLAWQRERS